MPDPLPSAYRSYYDPTGGYGGGGGAIITMGPDGAFHYSHVPPSAPLNIPLPTQSSEFVGDDGLAVYEHEEEEAYDDIPPLAPEGTPFDDDDEGDVPPLDGPPWEEQVSVPQAEPVVCETSAPAA